MSARSAQCEGCTTVFDVESTTGRLPTRCPGCRKGGGERSSASAKQSKKKGATKRPQKRSAPATGSKAIAAAVRALQVEIKTLEGQVQQRQDALDALQAIA